MPLLVELELFHGWYETFESLDSNAFGATPAGYDHAQLVIRAECASSVTPPHLRS